MSDALATTGVLLCGHGSRDPDTRAEFLHFTTAVSSALTSRHSNTIVEGACLEFSEPSIPEGLEKLASHGVKQIIAQPLMLFAARHARGDIPEAIKAFAATHPNIKVSCGEELPPDTFMLCAAAERIRTAEGMLSNALLLVIARGSSDPEANKIVAALAEELRHRLKMTDSTFAFAGIAEPDIEQGLADAIARGPKQIVVFPYFLFTGVLVKRVRRLTEQAAQQNPHIAFAVAHHLADHHAVVDAVVERIAKMADGSP
jgi:sirohydrochlorin cobaltochelatase